MTRLPVLRPLLGCLLTLSLWHGLSTASAQAVADAQSEPVRDPTQAPSQVGAASTGNASSGADARESSGVSIMVLNGIPHVIIGSRLYAQGEKWGAARIERITETEIWLREAGKLRKVSNFSGIERRTAKSVEIKPGCVVVVHQTAGATAATRRSDTCSTGQP